MEFKNRRFKQCKVSVLLMQKPIINEVKPKTQRILKPNLNEKKNRNNLMNFLLNHKSFNSLFHQNINNNIHNGDDSSLDIHKSSLLMDVKKNPNSDSFRDMKVQTIYTAIRKNSFKTPFKSPNTYPYSTLGIELSAFTISAVTIT